MTTRRGVLAGVGAAAIVFGFDPVARCWISEAQAAPFDHVPDLDGEIRTDPSSLAAYGTDLGNMVHNTPVAVLFPGSVKDIQKMIRFCKARGIKVAARGQGHATFGQAQAGGGLVISMRSLNQIHSIDRHCADLDAGATWKTLVQTTFPMGLTPPVLTGYTNLSIAGTLSMGGVSITNAQGAQVDRVQALEVVTGEGDREWCSEHRNSDLFSAALAGLGQCGIITRAVVDLVPAPPQSRVYLLTYSDNATFFADFRTLLNRGEFDGLYNVWLPGPAPGQFVYQLNAIKNFDPARPPDDNRLLRGLHYSALEASNSSYLDQVLSVDVIVDFLSSIGMFETLTHPWFDAFLPEDKIESYVGQVLPNLTPEDVGPVGFMLLFALKRSKLHRPLFRVPEQGKWVYLFDILTASATPNPGADYDARMLARNRTLFEKARAVGGTRYPIGSLEFSRDDWRRQYGRVADDLARWKRRFDPRGILTPGPGIF
ncbi:MAG TPA: FAD-binding protein [Polyangiaceae bacterium]